MPHTPPDFQALFDAAPSPYLILATDFTVAWVNAAYLQATRRQRKELIGRPMFEVFPDNPRDPAANGVANLRASLCRVLESKTVDTMAVQKYDIPVAGPEGVTFEERYWNPRNSPVLDAAGQVAHIIHQVEDVTDFVRAMQRAHRMEATIDAQALEIQTANQRLAEANALLEQKVVTRTQAQNKAEAQLRESEQRFRLLADSIPQVVWIVNAAGRGIYFNKQWAVYTGVAIDTTTPEEVSASFVHPDDHAITMRAWELAARTGHVYNVEHRIRSASGTYRWFLARAEPVRDTSGMVTRWFGTSTDVHDRKLAEVALRRSEERYRSLFTSIDEGFCVVEVLFDDRDRPYDYRFIEVNPSFEQQTGLDDPTGKTMRELTPTLESYWSEAYGRVLKTGESIRFKNEAKALKRWFDVFAFRIEDVVGPRVAILFNDITDRIRSEEALLQADRRKDEFLAMLAHELRNPLAPISAAADLLRLGRLDQPRVQQTSSIIARQVKHLTGLVDDLLDVSRVTRGLVQLDKAKVDAKKVVGDAIEQVRPLIEARCHRLAVHTPPESTLVLGDVKRLVQVLTNILNNAAKYTPEGGEISLGLEVDGDEVRIAVSDNGAGMTPELQATAFELFVQASRTSDRSQGGLGIGLALVKSLVALHGGSVSVHSEGLGQGSRFVVCLPHLPEDATSSSVEQRLAGIEVSSNALKMMVVDDNADAAQMLAMFLEALGHQVLVEQHPQRALERARVERPDICLLDIGLPDMDGNELARRLRSQPETSQTLLIAVTGYGQEQDRNLAASAGFDHHFAKPVDSGKLTALLGQLANGQGVPRNSQRAK